MRYKTDPEDFIVEERMWLPLAPKGRFAVYRVRKRGVTTLSVQAQMARTLGVAHSDVVFPALKDKEALAVQHAAVRGTGPARLAGKGFEAEFLGRSPRPLAPTDVVANRFTIVLRDLSAAETARVPGRLAHVSRIGLPNYFDQQRFGSLAAGQDHIAKRILQRDAEGALRAYLTQPFAGDPGRVRRFKGFAAAHWGDWDGLFEAAPRPSNYRSVLTYLRDHPSGSPDELDTHYRKALDLITRRLLSLYLAAYQSLLWNRFVSRYLVARLGDPLSHVEIAGERLAVHQELPPDLDPEVAVVLPHHRAVYDDPELKEVVSRVLAEEGFGLNDLKARILKKAYLSRTKRALLLFPEDAAAEEAGPDERFPGRSRVTLSFALPRGSYATLVIKVLCLQGAEEV
jgi:tRNA pseudouridine13 synthase